MCGNNCSRAVLGAQSSIKVHVTAVSPRELRGVTDDACGSPGDQLSEPTQRNSSMSTGQAGAARDEGEAIPLTGSRPLGSILSLALGIELHVPIGQGY